MPDCDGQTHHATLTVGPSRQAALGPRRKARGAEGQRRERVGATRHGRGGCASRAWGAQLAGAARTKLRGPRGLEDKTVTSHRPWAGSPRSRGHQGRGLPRPLSWARSCRLRVVCLVRVLALTPSSCTNTRLMGPVPSAHCDFVLTQLCLSRPCLQTQPHSED